MTEIWKDVVGYEGLYQVSNLGRVRSLDRVIKWKTRWGTIIDKKVVGRVLQVGLCSSGYCQVVLCNGGQLKTIMVHRLIAQAFISNPENKREVNHIDGNKQNNNVNNLEWVSREENLKHAIDVGLVENQCKIRRKVVITKNKFKKEFDSMLKCAEFFGFKKCWAHNRIRKFGNVFFYNGFKIEVGGRKK